MVGIRIAFLVFNLSDTWTQHRSSSPRDDDEDDEDKIPTPQAPRGRSRHRVPDIPQRWPAPSLEAEDSNEHTRSSTPQARVPQVSYNQDTRCSPPRPSIARPPASKPSSRVRSATPTGTRSTTPKPKNKGKGKGKKGGQVFSCSVYNIF